MSKSSPDIASLLGSRICHDLISPLGAISNGVELLTLTGVGEMPEMELISQSVENATARIEFFRVAFGTALPDELLGAAKVRRILEDLARDSRITFDWAVPEDVQRREVKLAFLLANCLEIAMPVGGTITVDREGDGWRVSARAERLQIDPALWEVLSRPETAADVPAAMVQFLIAPMVAAEIGRPLRVELSDDSAAVLF